MTKFKNFLLNESDLIYRRTKIIKPEEAMDFIKNKCTDVLDFYRKSNIRIFRGTSKGNYLYIDTRGKKERTSRDIPNFYTLIINNDQSWKNFPKRQIICSTIRVAYGNVLYVVFPVNGSKIGVCPESDIWYSFYGIKKARIKSIVIFLDELDIFFEKHVNINIKTYEDLKKACDEIDKKINNRNKIIFEFINYDEFKKRGLFNILIDLFSPKNFEVVDTKKLNKLKSGREVWMDTECVFIGENEFSFFDELEIKNIIKEKIN